LSAEKNGEKHRDTEEKARERNERGNYLEWCLREYEMSMNRTTEESEKPEFFTGTRRSDNSVDGNKPKENDQYENKDRRPTIEDQSQQADQQHQNTNRESRQNLERALPERSRPDHEEESDQSIKQAANNREENGCFGLNEELQAFTKGNPELFPRQGMILEKGEAKELDNETKVKLDESERLTIIHKDQTYEIKRAEQERIGDLELLRYKTAQGEEFVHIPRENKTIPPYETPWYALPANTDIHLDKEYKRELLEAAIDKAGTKAALQREFENTGVHFNHGYAYDHLSERREGMEADKLISILVYLGRDLDESNNHITAIGHGRAVENPNLPFKLDTVDGSRLVAARLSDGTLYMPKDRGPLFEYTNQDAEQRSRVVESLTNIFGKVNVPIRERDRSGSRKVEAWTSTEIIGHVLRRAGAVTGVVVEQNPDIPLFILRGSEEMKREWLRQAFGDEGWTQDGFPMMCRSVDVTRRLSGEQRRRLDTLSEGWKRARFPDGTEKKQLRFNRLPDDIKEKLIKEPPRLLESEERMLNNDFGMSFSKYPEEIHTREGGYSVRWTLHSASRESGRMFCDQIGFPQDRKQEKLTRPNRSH
jgi:hypothetical protein